MSLLEKYIESMNESERPLYKKGQRIQYQLEYKGGVGQYADSKSKSSNVETGVIKKRKKTLASYEYELTSGLVINQSEIIGLDENQASATLGSVNGMGSVALPGNPGTQNDYVTSETGSGDIPYNLTKGTPKKRKKKKMKRSFLTFNTYIDTLKESLNEFGPLAGSGNRDELEDKRREARTQSERKSGQTFYVVGEKHGSYKVSKYYEDDNTYAAFHNGMAIPVDESVNEKTLSYKPEIGLGKKVKNIKEIIDGGVYWIAVPDENGTWYEVVSYQRSYQRKGEWFFNDMGGGSSLSFKDAELKREIGKGNVYHKK